MGRSLRIALLSYRSKPHSGGQGIYVRALSRELTELGHRVEVLSGQPYPELDDGVALTRLPSLDLYREPDPFRTPRPSEFRDWIDVAEWATMCTAGFPEPLTFTLRAARHLLPRARRVRRRPRQPVPRLRAAAADPRRPADRRDRPPPDRHRPPAGARRRPVAAPPADAAPLVRLHRACRPGSPRRLDAVTTVSENSAPRHRHAHGRWPPEGIEVIPVGIDPDEFTPPPAGQPRDRDSILVITSADVAAQGPGAPARGAGQAAHRATGRAHRRRHRPARRPGRGRAGPARPCATPSASPGRCPRPSSSTCCSAPTVVGDPVALRGLLAARRSRRWPAATPLVTTDAGALPEVVGTQGRAAGARRRRRRADRGAAAGARLAVAGRAAGPRRPAPGARQLHLAGDRRAHRRLVRARRWNGRDGRADRRLRPPRPAAGR